ncbi:hypothetical protein BH11BAC3_BH11BAC3_02840 [soil metagenome]
MKYKLNLLLITFLCWNITYGQSNSVNLKECRIAGGFGFAGAANNLKAIGKSSWLQLDYLFTKQFSVATEFQNSQFTNNGPNPLVRFKPNEEIIVNNSFTLLLKYHLQEFGKFKAAIGTGWAYNIEASDYYSVQIDSNSYSALKYVNYYDDYRIPLIVQLDYPLSKVINIQTRVRYNVSRQYGNSYSAGIAIAVKL